VPALQAALPLPQVDRRAEAIREHLDLDVPRVGDEALDEQRVVAEGGGGLAAGRGQRRARSRPLDQPHALAAAARGRLDHEGIADLRRPRDQVLVGQAGLGAAGDHRDTGRRDGLLGPILSPIVSMACGGGPDEDQPAAAQARAKASFSARKP
jgi:hypothetical protein